MSKANTLAAVPYNDDPPVVPKNIESAIVPAANRKAVTVAPTHASPQATSASGTVLYTSVNIDVISAKLARKLMICSANAGTSNERCRYVAAADTVVFTTSDINTSSPAPTTIMKP